jgi:hypothetical protein
MQKSQAEELVSKTCEKVKSEFFFFLISRLLAKLVMLVLKAKQRAVSVMLKTLLQNVLLLQQNCHSSTILLFITTVICLQIVAQNCQVQYLKIHN